MSSYKTMYLIPQLEYDSYVMRAADRFRQYNNVDVNDGGKVVIRNDDHVKQCNEKTNPKDNIGNNTDFRGNGGKSNEHKGSNNGDDDFRGNLGNPKPSTKIINTTKDNTVQNDLGNNVQRNKQMNDLVNGILNRFKQIDKEKSAKASTGSVSTGSVQTDNTLNFKDGNTQTSKNKGVEVQTQFNPQSTSQSTQVTSRNDGVEVQTQFSPQSTSQSTQVYPQSKSKIIQVGADQDEKSIQANPLTQDHTSQTDVNSTMETSMQTDYVPDPLPTIVEVPIVVQKTPVSTSSVDTQTELTNDLVQRIQDILFGVNSRHEPNDTEMNSERIADVTDMYQNRRSEPTDRKIKSKFRDRESAFHPYRRSINSEDSDSKKVREILDEILIRVRDKVQNNNVAQTNPENIPLPVEFDDPSTVPLPEEKDPSLEEVKEARKAKGKGKKSKSSLTQPLKKDEKTSKGTWVELQRSPVKTRSKTREGSTSDDINGLKVLSGKVQKSKNVKTNKLQKEKATVGDARKRKAFSVELSKTVAKKKSKDDEENSMKKVEKSTTNEDEENKRKRKAFSVEIAKTVSKKKSKDDI